MRNDILRAHGIVFCFIAAATRCRNETLDTSSASLPTGIEYFEFNVFGWKSADPF
jgi:hypothetical protein